MSIKHFHIAFIIFCTLFSLGFSAWCLVIPGQPSVIEEMGWISLAGGIALLIYGIRFYRKIKNVIT
jgi:hypothetical protein